MIKSLIAGVLIGFILIGCGTPRIDTSSDEKLKSSIQKVKDSLSLEQKKTFEDSLQIIMFSKINLGSMIMGVGNPSFPNNLTDSVKASLNNKSAEEVILEATKIKEEKAKEAERIKQEQLEREKKEALEEIKKLEDRKAYAEQSKEELKKIEIINAQFKQAENKYISQKEPAIKLVVKNNTNKAISRIYCIGTVKSIGREIPWIKEDFNYSIAGGLEAGETATWYLAPNMFSKWGSVETPKDAFFEVEVVEIEGADNKSIASIRDFTEEENIKLQNLKAKFN